MLGDPAASIAITDDEPLQLVITSPQVTEGDSGTTSATFSVAVEPAPPAGTAVSVDHLVEGLSATVPDDVLATGGSLEFVSTDGPKSVAIEVVGDDALEGPEAFRLVLAAATASDGRPVLLGDDLPGLIVDDDAPSPTPSPSPPPSPTPPADRAPSVDAGPDGAGAEGTAIGLDATTADADAGDTLTAAWTYEAGADVHAGATCSFADGTQVDTTLTCTDDGTYTASLEVTDSQGHAASDACRRRGRQRPGPGPATGTARPGSPTSCRRWTTGMAETGRASRTRSSSRSGMLPGWWCSPPRDPCEAGT